MVYKKTADSTYMHEAYDLFLLLLQYFLVTVCSYALNSNIFSGLIQRLFSLHFQILFFFIGSF